MFEGFALEALAILERHPWPGNVRELQNTVERAVILSTDPVLRPGLFETERDGLLRHASGEITPSLTPDSLPPGAIVLTSMDVGEAERVLIQHALEATAGNRTHAAKLLGISVRTLRNKLNLPVSAEGAPEQAEVPAD